MYEKKLDLLAFNYKYHSQNDIEIGVLSYPKNSEFMNKVTKLHDLGFFQIFNKKIFSTSCRKNAVLGLQPKMNTFEDLSICLYM